MGLTEQNIQVDMQGGRRGGGDILFYKRLLITLLFFLFIDLKFKLEMEKKNLIS